MPSPMASTGDLDAMMQQTADRILRSRIKREIVLECADKAKSVGDVASALGRPDGAVRGGFMSLLEEGIIEPAPLPGDRRARGFKVARDYRALVDALRVRPEEVGRLRDDGYLVTVTGPRISNLLPILSDVSEARHFVWAARMAGPGRVLLFFDGNGRAEVDRLCVRLERHGFEAAADEVAAQLGPRAMREWAADAMRDEVHGDSEPVRATGSGA